MQSGEPPYTQDMENGYEYEYGPADTRVFLRVYAALAGAGGFVLLGWGPLLLPGPGGLDRSSLIRVFGSILMGAACCALGLGSVEDAAARRRGLLLLAVGHAMVAAVVWSQQVAIWGPQLEWVVQWLVWIDVCLLFLWHAAGQVSAWRLGSLFGGRAVPAENLRSRYERQIREAAAQEERNRLARELHDSIKQQIFVIQTAAATAQARFDGDSAGSREALQQVRSSAHDVMTEMEVMLDQLRAEPLENAGLVAALKKQCEALGFRTGARVEFQFEDLPASTALPPGAPQALLRAAQEALANVGRHARAHHVWVRLGKTLGGVELTVRDDGAGFDPNQTSRGMGTANLRARAEEFGGTFELSSRPGEGTSLRFFIPEMLRGGDGRSLRTLYVLQWSALLAFLWKKNAVTAALLALLSAAYLVADHRARKRSEAGQ